MGLKVGWREDREGREGRLEGGQVGLKVGRRELLLVYSVDYCFLGSSPSLH